MFYDSKLFQIVLVAFSHSAAAISQSSAIEPCPMALEMPTYPPLAWAARIAGTGTATVTLDSARVRTIKAVGLNPLLVAEVERTIRRSQFADCGRRELTIQYDFVVEGAEAASRVTTIIILGASHFRIKVNPPAVMP